MPTKVFFVKEQGDVQLYLRRFSFENTCTTNSYCNAKTRWMRAKAKRDAKGYYKNEWVVPPKDTEAWPTQCSKCQRAFTDADEYQVFSDVIFIADDGQEWVQNDLPPGACFDAWWYHDVKDLVGPDGRSLQVVLPNGDKWLIDGKASNCTRPDDNEHKCWVRHGSPEGGDLHVGKNGNTCAAGAGSIAVPGYHGFLHNGWLT